uniref:Uncharacterized protein n=1 Tax=Anguilla anguilla TaxID=7936 RepID=A0A0E9WFJ7_ANGAN
MTLLLTGTFTDCDTQTGDRHSHTGTRLLTRHVCVDISFLRGPFPVRYTHTFHSRAAVDFVPAFPPPPTFS